MTQPRTVRKSTWCLLMALTACVPAVGTVTPPPITLASAVSVPSDQPAVGLPTAPRLIYDRNRQTTLTLAAGDISDGDTLPDMSLDLPFLINRSLLPDASSLTPQITESGGLFQNGRIGLIEPDATASDVQVNGVVMRPCRVQFGGTRSPGTYAYEISTSDTTAQNLTVTVPVSPIQGRPTVALSSLTDPGATISWSAATGHTQYRLDVSGANLSSPPPRGNGYLGGAASLRLSSETTSFRIGQSVLGADSTPVRLPSDLLDDRGDRLKAGWFYTFRVTAVAEQRALNGDRVIFEQRGPALKRP